MPKPSFLDLPPSFLQRFALYSAVFMCFMFSGAMSLGMFMNPPKRINPTFGYRSELSAKNQQNWDYANKLCGTVGLWSAGYFLVSSFLFIYFGSRRLSVMLIGVVVFGNLLASQIAVIPVVEHQLRQFDQANQQ